MDFSEDLKNINILNIIQQKRGIIGLDIGDKTIGVAVADRRCKIAGFLGLIIRNPRHPKSDCNSLYKMVAQYNPGLLIFGWPLQMDGNPGQQCKKNSEFIKAFKSFWETQQQNFSEDLIFSKWDERFSTKAVTNIMIEADLSRKRRKEIVDKTAAVYILQGAVDFLNRDIKVDTSIIERKINNE